MPELSLAKRASRSRKTRISSFEFSADQIEAVRQLVGRTIADVECELIIKTLADQRSVPCEIRSTNTMSMEKSCPNQPLIEYCPLWVKADILRCGRIVRFTPESEHSRLHLECPLSANSGILPGLSYDECTARVPPTARPARTKRSRSSNADSSVLGHAIRLPSSKTDRFASVFVIKLWVPSRSLAAHDSSAVLGRKLF